MRLFKKLIFKLIDYTFFREIIPKLNTVYTYNQFHIGDNLIHIHFLKRLAEENSHLKFKHYADKNYLSDLREYVKDTPSIFIEDLSRAPFFSINVWKNHEEFWVNSPYALDFSGFHLDFFRKLSVKLGLNNPINTVNDLIFDSEFFEKNSVYYDEYDWLVVNSDPLSSQFFDEHDFLNKVIKAIASEYSVITTKKIEGIPCTRDKNYNLHDIASQSIRCKYHLMISTGPSWLVLNQYNCKNSLGIYMLLRDEQVILSKNMKNFSSAESFYKFYSVAFNKAKAVI